MFKNMVEDKSSYTKGKEIIPRGQLENIAVKLYGKVRTPPVQQQIMMVSSHLGSKPGGKHSKSNDIIILMVVPMLQIPALLATRLLT